MHVLVTILALSVFVFLDVVEDPGSGPESPISPDFQTWYPLGFFSYKNELQVWLLWPGSRSTRTGWWSPPTSSTARARTRRSRRRSSPRLATYNVSFLWAGQNLPIYRYVWYRYLKLRYPRTGVYAIFYGFFIGTYLFNKVQYGRYKPWAGTVTFSSSSCLAIRILIILRSWIRIRITGWWNFNVTLNLCFESGIGFDRIQLCAWIRTWGQRMTQKKTKSLNIMFASAWKTGGGIFYCMEVLLEVYR